MIARVRSFSALMFAAWIIFASRAALAHEPGQSAQAPPASQASASTAAPSANSATTTGGTPAPSPVPAEASHAPASSASLALEASPARLPQDDTLIIEGEKRFATNCGRCHQSPHHFPPRMMATIMRHMRVRATITDEDMRLILRYMTQ